jgi:hypothetical protein
MVRLRIGALILFCGLFGYSLVVLYQQESKPKDGYTIYHPSIITVEELPPVRAENK